jgi:hypothetical protein
MSFRRIFLAAVFFIPLAFVPVIYFHDKKVWAPVWLTYPGFFALLSDGGLQSLLFAALCILIIAAHLALSYGFAVLIERLLFRK